MTALHPIGWREAKEKTRPRPRPGLSERHEGIHHTPSIPRQESLATGLLLTMAAWSLLVLSVGFAVGLYVAGVAR